ncbi:hypothetical protein LTS18_004143 [Coniosporium uncinatum]|uniref:Uncharacterized protein n=1 Tax=Coniosporium uncinatum TaxID=93489 RepID=A0ACC3DYI4_9PEZI|nr:hypothetical protein LTS18_004143 [Coniosporium uncinatum]
MSSPSNDGTYGGNGLPCSWIRTVADALAGKDEEEAVKRYNRLKPYLEAHPEGRAEDTVVCKNWEDRLDIIIWHSEVFNRDEATRRGHTPFPTRPLPTRAGKPKACVVGSDSMAQEPEEEYAAVSEGHYADIQAYRSWLDGPFGKLAKVGFEEFRDLQHEIRQRRSKRIRREANKLAMEKAQESQKDTQEKQ